MLDRLTSLCCHLLLAFLLFLPGRALSHALALLLLLLLEPLKL